MLKTATLLALVLIAPAPGYAEEEAGSLISFRAEAFGGSSAVGGFFGVEHVEPPSGQFTFGYSLMVLATDVYGSELVVVGPGLVGRWYPSATAPDGFYLESGVTLMGGVDAGWGTFLPEGHLGAGYTFRLTSGWRITPTAIAGGYYSTAAYAGDVFAGIGLRFSLPRHRIGKLFP